MEKHFGQPNTLFIHSSIHLLNKDKSKLFHVLSQTFSAPVPLLLTQIYPLIKSLRA